MTLHWWYSCTSSRWQHTTQRGRVTPARWWSSSRTLTDPTVPAGLSSEEESCPTASRWPGVSTPYQLPFPQPDKASLKFHFPLWALPDHIWILLETDDILGSLYSRWLTVLSFIQTSAWILPTAHWTNTSLTAVLALCFQFKKCLPLWKHCQISLCFHQHEFLKKFETTVLKSHLHFLVLILINEFWEIWGSEFLYYLPEFHR